MVELVSFADRKELRECLRLVARQAWLAETVINAQPVNVEQLADALMQLHADTDRVTRRFLAVLTAYYLRPPSDAA